MRLYNSISIIVAIGLMAILVSFSPSSSEEVAGNQICIDENIQNTLDTLLVERMAELNVPAAWGAVMEVSSGNLVAVSSWGNNQGTVSKIENNLFLDLRDPGSIFQTVSYAALLETGSINPESIVDTGSTEEHPSTFNYHGKRMADDYPVGIVTAKEAIVQGSTIAIVKLVSNAFEENPQVFMEAIAKLGWDETPLMIYEGDTLRTPHVRKYKDNIWSRLTLGQISYGYEMRTTPMHSLLFFNSIANDGVRPGFGRVCSEQTAKMVRSALEGVVDHGTACTKWSDSGDIIREGAKSRKVTIAGKTGRAQIFANGTYYGNGNYATFVGFFPAEQPKYSCLVTFKAVRGGNFERPDGGSLAGPVVRDLAEALLCK